MLVAAFPPRRLIAAAEAPSASGAAGVAEAMLLYPTTNKRYRREMAQVWALAISTGQWSEPGEHLERLDGAHMAWAARELVGSAKPPIADHDPVIGAVLVELATRKIVEWPTAMLYPATPEVEGRLRVLLQRCAEAAQMQKNGDDMLHTLLRLKLRPRSLAAMVIEAPYEAINAAYGRSANDVVGDLLKTPPDGLADLIDYSSMAPEGAAIAGGLLCEMFDGTPSSLAINHEVLYRRVPTITAFASFGGVCIPDTLAVCDGPLLLMAPATRPLATVIAEWARRTPGSNVYLALTEPILLPPGSLARRWLLE